MKAYPSIPTPISGISSELTRPPSSSRLDAVRDTRPLEETVTDRHAGGLDMKTSLGIWAFGSMVTRFVPGGYQPQHAGESTTAKVARAVGGLGELIDDYEFHYPQELDEENLEEVRAALDGHGIYAVAAGA